MSCQLISPKYFVSSVHANIFLKLFTEQAAPVCFNVKFIYHSFFLSLQSAAQETAAQETAVQETAAQETAAQETAA